MRLFHYSAIKDQKWDSDILGLIAAIYKEAGKQELYLKQRPEELEKLVEIATVQSTEASLLRIHESGNWLRRKQHRETVTSRKSQGTAMYCVLFMRALMRFPLRKTTSYSSTKFCTAI